MKKTAIKTKDKHDIFCREYLIDRNATRSAIEAGYSEKTAAQAGSRLLKNVKIIDRIIELSSERNKRCEIDADYVLTQAVKLHERCMQEVDPVMLPSGKQKTEQGRPVFKFDSMGAKAALELVGKHVNVQAFKDRIEIEENQTLTPWSMIEAGIDE